MHFTKTQKSPKMFERWMSCCVESYTMEQGNQVLDNLDAATDYSVARHAGLTALV